MDLQGGRRVRCSGGEDIRPPAKCREDAERYGRASPVNQETTAFAA